MFNGSCFVAGRVSVVIRTARWDRTCASIADELVVLRCYCRHGRRHVTVMARWGGVDVVLARIGGGTPKPGRVQPADVTASSWQCRLGRRSATSLKSRLGVVRSRLSSAPTLQGGRRHPPQVQPWGAAVGLERGGQQPVESRHRRPACAQLGRMLTSQGFARFRHHYGRCHEPSDKDPLAVAKWTADSEPLLARVLGKPLYGSIATSQIGAFPQALALGLGHGGVPAGRSAVLRA